MKWVTPDELLARQRQAAHDRARRKPPPPPPPPPLVETTCCICGQSIYSPYGRVICGATCKTVHDRELRRLQNIRLHGTLTGERTDLTLQDWLATIRAFANRCAYCGGAWDTLDHVTPRADGAGTSYGNVVPACKACNGRKGSRHLDAIADLPQEGIARVRRFVACARS